VGRQKERVYENIMNTMRGKCEYDNRVTRVGERKEGLGGDSGY